MAAGTCIVNNGGGVSSCEYIMRDKESLMITSNLGSDKKSILQTVRKYDAIEKAGDKTLGIRGRHDARSMKKVIISLPNNNSLEENTALLHQLLHATGISEYPHLAVIHRGEKDGIVNRHAHINFFERKFELGNSNKNRAFNKKSFVHSFRHTYQELFGLRPNEEIRSRIDRVQYQKVQALQKELHLLKTVYSYELGKQSAGELGDELDKLLVTDEPVGTIRSADYLSEEADSTAREQDFGVKRRRLRSIGETLGGIGKSVSDGKQESSLQHRGASQGKKSPGDDKRRNRKNGRGFKL